MDYKGWKLYNDVIIVIKNDNEENRKYDKPQGYVVDSKNKKQLESAISWGTVYNYTKDEKTGRLLSKTVSPTLHTVPNSGFEIELLDSAKSSSQGGKLSFWNCLITNKEAGICCVIGIDSTMLLELLLENTFINGKCTEQVFFARRQGGLGVLTKSMKGYTEALNDEQTRKNVTKKATRNWEIGKNYVTLKMDETYLGNIYLPFDTDYIPNSGFYYNRKNNKRYILKYNENPDVKVLLCRSDAEGIKSLSELKEKTLRIVDDNIKNIKESNIKDVVFYKLASNTILYKYFDRQGKLPARQQGDISIEVDMDINDFYNDITEYIQNKIIELYNEGMSICAYGMERVLFRTSEFSIDNLNEREQKILNILKSNIDTKLEL